MKIKTSELSGPALDWAVARCLHPESWMVLLHQDHKDIWHVKVHGKRGNYAPSTNWAQADPIIYREKIGFSYYNEGDGWEVPGWGAWRTDVDFLCRVIEAVITGPTPLIAAMRCFVASVLGDEVEIPEELV